MNRTPTIEEVSKKTEIPEEDIIYALDAIATPMSLFEPVYQDGNDPLFLMDQICDKKNKEDTWIEHLSLQEAMNQLSGREYHIIEKRFFEGNTRKQKLLMKSASRRLREQVGKKCTEIYSKLY